MSRLSRLSPNDLDRLSAYLDRELPPVEMAEVEARLRADPEFRRAHEELRQLAVALRAVGEVHVPRNFTLHAADGRRRASAGYPALRFATALASVAFVLLAGVRYVLPLGAAAPAAMMASAPEAEMAFRAQDEVGGTPAGAAELQAQEVPVAEPTFAAPLAGALAAAGTATAAPTPVPESESCPACPSSAAEAAATVGADDLQVDATEIDAGAPEQAGIAEGRGISPLAAAQWIIGAAALSLLALTLRARRAG